MLRTHLISLLAAVGVAHPAPAPVTPQEYLNLAVAASISYWGGGAAVLPPCGVPQIEWVEASVIPGAGATGNAQTCMIRISRESWPVKARRDRYQLGRFFLLVVHEVGHVYGYAHQPGTVMDANVLPTQLCASVPPCQWVLAWTYPIPGVTDVMDFRLRTREEYVPTAADLAGRPSLRLPPEMQFGAG